ncbi:hypothetical protein AGMMS49957_07430 [Synergistales bacterium]|nr:hypothetical protein AGMMS49957_07430 [Synergistales bacterium]
MSHDNNAAGGSLLGALSDRVNYLCEAGLFITLTLMTLITILQIVCRLWFKALTWSEEVACFLLVFASFLGSTVAFKRGANIAVNFLIEALPKAIKKVTLAAIDLVGVAFFGALAWYGAVLCINQSAQLASSIPISMSYMYAVFPITGAIVILHLLSHIEKLFRSGEGNA